MYVGTRRTHKHVAVLVQSNTSVYRVPVTCCGLPRSSGLFEQTVRQKYQKLLVCMFAHNIGSFASSKSEKLSLTKVEKRVNQISVQAVNQSAST